MSGSPLVLAHDRFPTSLPGRRVPVSDAEPTSHRPWGMSHAIEPRPTGVAGRHEKPTENRVETQPTQHNVDNKVETDLRP
ncbi:ATP-grasp-modified RiPP [Nocardiopsis rhodophaea]